MFLDYAKSNGVSVTFKYTDGRDLLHCAITSRSEPRVEFLLGKLTGKYATLTETIGLLGSNISRLADSFPKLTLRFLKEDGFAMEYARFEAPKALFGRNGKTRVGMYARMKHNPKSWQAMDSTAAKELWIEKSRYGTRLSDATDRQIKVVAKFSCIRPGSFLAVYGKKYVYGKSCSTESGAMA